MDSDTKHELDLYRKMGTKKLRFGGDFGNKSRAQVNAEDDGMELVRKTLEVSFGLKGFTEKSFRPQVQEVVKSLFVRISRRASVDITGSGASKHRNELPPDKVEMYDIRVGAGTLPYYFPKLLSSNAIVRSDNRK
jgi:hypothetical protein